MKKSEAKNTEANPDNAQANLSAPVRLTPEELENVAAGFMAQISRGGAGGGTGATTGLYPAQPTLKLR